MIIFSKFQGAVLDNQGDPIPVRIIPMRRSRLSQYKQNKLIELFVAGVTARAATQLVGVKKYRSLLFPPAASAYISQQPAFENV